MKTFICTYKATSDKKKRCYSIQSQNNNVRNYIEEESTDANNGKQQPTRSTESTIVDKRWIVAWTEVCDQDYRENEENDTENDLK